MQGSQKNLGDPHGIWLRETTFDRLTCLGWPYPQLKWQGPRGLKKIHYPLNIHTYMIWCRATNFGMVSHLGEGKVCRDWLHTHFQGAGAQSQNFSPCWRDAHTIWCKATSFGVVTYLVKGKCCRWSATPYNPRGGGSKIWTPFLDADTAWHTVIEYSTVTSGERKDFCGRLHHLKEGAEPLGSIFFAL